MTLIPDAPEPTYDRSHHYHEGSPFRARWVSHPDAPAGNDFAEPFVADYVLTFDVAAAATVRVRVSADERYALEIDGERVGRGPERGDVRHWCMETYDLPLGPGPHRLTARVHSLGRHRPYAQFSVRHGFLLMAEGEWDGVLSTGVARWTGRRVNDYAAVPVPVPGFPLMMTGPRFRIDPKPAGEAAAVGGVGPLVLASMRMESPGQWQLAPGTLPAMLERPAGGLTLRRLEGSDDEAGWRAFARDGVPLTVPPHTAVTALLDFDEYYCVYPRLTVDGGAGASVNVELAEALFDGDGRKHHRDRVDGLRFVGVGDTFVCPGRRHAFTPLWWLAGRYVQVTVRTADEPLHLQALQWTETRYPLTWDGGVTAEDPDIAALLPPARRAMEVCSHETYFDCPYFEQLMYVGDTRLEALVTYTHCRDDRLPRKAVRLFDQSRTPDGWTQGRYPTKVSQTIPPFSLWWVAMVHDLMLWRDVPGDVAARLAGVRAVMEAAYAQCAADDLYQPTTGWNFVDWVRGWSGGYPPGAAERPVAPVHFQLAYVARLAAEIEDHAGDPLLAQRHRRQHAALLAAGRAAFWDEGRGLFRDATGTHGADGLSEHAQVMAVLAGAADDTDTRARVTTALIAGPDMARTTIYYTHYLFEAVRQLDRIDLLFERLRLWSSLAAAGLKTTPEQPEPTRSDCHAWGAHPMFHLLATVLGVRPSGPGFAGVRIEPRLGPLERLSGRVVHPWGLVTVRARQVAGRLEADVELPPGVAGELHANGTVTPLPAR